jgi:hypothetical protein
VYYVERPARPSINASNNQLLLLGISALQRKPTSRLVFHKFAAS